jgi:hypothetical protein
MLGETKKKTQKGKKKKKLPVIAISDHLSATVAATAATALHHRTGLLLAAVASL